MEFHQLKCPNCGADLTVENDLDSFYCKYCGTKLLVAGRDANAIQAKVDLKKAEIEADIAKAKMKHDKDETKFIFIWYALFMIGILVFIAFMEYFHL